MDAINGIDFLNPVQSCWSCLFQSGGEAFAAGAMWGGVWIGHFEATLLQVIAEIQGRAADEQRTLGIDHDPDIGGMN
jgi:hypothetical protein